MKLASSAARRYDAIIVGGGHNGLVAAAYLAKAGKRVAVLERRHVLGGAAVTEELFPGFKYSRASYVYSLFRPQIVRDLDLHRHGLKLIPRVPSSFTPSLSSDAPSLLLGGGVEHDTASIAQFSERDAQAYGRYNALLDRYSDAFRPLLDRSPPDPSLLFAFKHFARGVRGLSRADRRALVQEWTDNAKDAVAAVQAIASLGKDLPSFIQFLLAPATKTLDGWFKSDVLKATLATDAVIGSMSGPSTPQSSYVLLHHVMCGVWQNPVGGMGSVTQAIAGAAREHGADLRTSSTVKRILLEDAAASEPPSLADGVRPAARVNGVELEDGSVLTAPVVIANAAPHTVFSRLLAHAPEALPPRFASDVANTLGPSGAVKINVALDRLPNFVCRPNSVRYEVPGAAATYGSGGAPIGSAAGGGSADQIPLPHHRGTIHFESSVSQIDAAFADALAGRPSRRPVIEMTLPSALDPTIAPPGKHVALLFCQYAPYRFADGRTWDDVPGSREAFADSVFDVIEQYAPGFKASVLHRDILAPPDLERIFGLPQGNIFHAPMGLDALLWMRPLPGASRYRAPGIAGLYQAGAGSHPGGGVIGAPGANCARAVLRDLS